MKLHRRTTQRLQSTKPLVLLILVSCLLIMIIFIPPVNILIISLGIIASTVIAYLTSSYFLSRKRQIMTTSFVFFSLTMSFLLGFELFNTLLLLSFIIVVAKLFPNKNTKIE
ncbi:hypothetical protein CO051_01470 [Candidatus Roizmanbacteria bacterium CG_4_9_14_0_2_um_filter_39_13]|uniref:Uncharacterized protein n=2 Tax=Candidatus Roizmaniibacteriota TaxID=1752723 RepID=A0A2M8F2A6_9BACT|nr:MAG: hypothetical protein COY15_05755 [Candidatus Roizmanbacteria bacterium CG_4_10_14_0_2_um_filter_39_12]PJC33416.1 MAG: hypothetical protein CO051_01470 [Candidatus Roizmanbacteria bacterium CG_4_9_14_0_2_um_filter_39_13]PJE62237.1 MAG: hypothetical protein COU87_00360 [Candidatus Roizmanbacteria bacterium CG10_big_fil_rev_8_21_14_0_10_39_12]